MSSSATPLLARGPSANASPYATHISTYLGFDQCEAPTANLMESWYNASPYADTGIYIGGGNRGCSPPNLNTTYVQQLLQMGWGLMPLWVGPQAPCTTGFPGGIISSNTTTAASQGVTEAQSAITAALDLGLANSIIYYDIEPYTHPAGCNVHAAVAAFLNAWTQTLHNNSYQAGPLCQDQ
jgi:hypothetical protein